MTHGIVTCRQWFEFTRCTNVLLLCSIWGKVLY